MPHILQLSTARNSHFLLTTLGQHRPAILGPFHEILTSCLLCADLAQVHLERDPNMEIDIYLPVSKKKPDLVLSWALN